MFSFIFTRKIGRVSIFSKGHVVEDQIEIIIIITITLFQEDNIFGTDASLTYEIFENRKLEKNIPISNDSI